MSDKERLSVEDTVKRIGGAKLVEYDHGGGRLYFEEPGGARDLIADFYGEGHYRDFIMTLAYMLIGYDKAETWDRIWHRFDRMVERGIKPYPMVYDRTRKDLCAFQRWVKGLYRIVPWNEYAWKAA